MKLNFFKMLSTERWKDSAIFFMRIFIGIMMLSHGLEKINNYEMLFTTFPSIFGMSSNVSLMAVIIAEIGCSALLIIGLFVRPAAIVLAATMLAATIITISQHSFATSELSFIYLGVYVMLAISGGMRYSLDRVFFSRHSA